MSKYRVIQNNFLFGEISRKSRSRSDIEEYDKSCQLMERFFPLVNGGAAKTPGTHFRFDLSNMDSPGLIPFSVDKTLGYWVALDPAENTAGQYIRVIRNDGTEMTVNQAPYVALDGVWSTFDTTIDPRGFVYAQFGDALIITHSSGRQLPMVLQRLTATTFDLRGYGEVNLFNDSEINGLLKTPYRDPNIGSITMTPSGTTGVITITASAAFFNAGMKGGFFKITHGAVTGVARLTAFNSTTEMAALVNIDFNAITASTNWEEAAWSDYRGWPRSVVLFEQRLVWAGNASQPDSIWGSLTGNIFHMMARKLAQDSATDVSGVNYFGAAAVTDPFTFIIGSDDANPIQWLAPANALYVGSLSTEYSGRGSGGDILSSSSVDFKSQTGYGSSPTKVFKVGNEVLYVSRDGRKVRTFRFSEENGSNISFNLSYLADHMSRIGGSEYGFIDASYQQSRDTMWYINKNNYLVGLTYSRETGAMGWFRFPITNALAVRGVATIPNPEGNYDLTGIVVEREIDGNTVYYLETIGADFDADSLDNDGTLEEDIPNFLDCSVDFEITNPAGQQTFPVLSHLANETVTVTKNGFLLGDFEVNGAGSVDLGEVYPEGDIFVFGYKFTAKMELNPVQGGGDFGAHEAATRSLDTVFLDLYKTYDLKVGTTSARNKLLPIKFGADILTQIVEKNLNDSPKLENGIVFESSEPYPCNILFAVSKGGGND